MKAVLPTFSEYCTLHSEHCQTWFTCLPEVLAVVVPSPELSGINLMEPRRDLPGAEDEDSSARLLQRNIVQYLQHRNRSPIELETNLREV